ncbi:PAS domain S-box protein, partial [Methanosalsum natronophilum]
GKTREEIIGKSVQNVLPENTSALITEHIEDVLKSSSYVSFEHTLRLDDTERMIKTVIFPLFDETKNISSLGVIGEDITDLKKIEEFEKNQLIVHEIHHRVKNNLQVISSLLNMQSKLFEDEDVRDAFLDSQNRIRSMSLAHEKLYSTDKAGQIEMADYIKSLVDYISQLYKPINKTILTKLNTDTIYFDMDTAIPLSLLLNEIITNSYKHAFVGKDKGTISISFKKMEQEYQLVVQDDGTGFPENIDPENSNSLGFRIINLLSKQLFAEIEVDSSKGTSYTITIKK